MAATLEQIVTYTRMRVAAAKRVTTIGTLEREAELHQPRGFARILKEASRNGIAVIAELKKASPSRGLIRADFNPTALAEELVAAGAPALSVLTDEQFFQGSIKNLVEVSQLVPIPILRKDFIVDEFQVVESRAHRADAILLIVAALTDSELRKLYARAKQLGLDVLCEVHDRRELQRALAIGFDIIGVNSRDLRTFHVDLSTALQLGLEIPSNVLRIAESGIHTGKDIDRLRTASYEAFLIGESLMKAEHPGEALSTLVRSAEQPQKATAQ
jgi:indole-3-glycerol phosphate synthase